MEAAYVNDQFKLRFLYLFSRHGDRVPLRHLPDDPHRDHWSSEPGSLTKKGKMEAFNLGRILRQRYNTFLGDKYICENVYARSTDLDRTLMSCQCTLAGMFPPTEEEIIVPGLKWQPTSIHTKPITEDQLQIKIVTGLQKPPGGIYRDPEHENYYETIKKNKELLSIIDSIGKCNNQFNLQILTMDTILIQKENNLSIPIAIETRFADFIQLYESNVLHGCIYNDEVHEGTSNLFKEILENMENLFETEQTSTERKTFFYSLHDLHVIAMIYALTKKGIMAPTSSCVILEVYQHTKNLSEFYIQLLFWKDHNKEPMKLKIQDKNEEICTFENFKNTVEDYININTIRTKYYI